MKSFAIRKGTACDIDRIMQVYDSARRRMRRRGNPNQWINGYPSRELILNDIAAGDCYVGILGGEVAMVFSFIIGDDPTYAVIEDGEWLNRLPYGTVHRLGALPQVSGAFAKCLDYCFTQTGNIRLDTHADNTTMQRLATAYGFVRCGTIHCADGSPRIAYQLARPAETRQR